MSFVAYYIVGALCVVVISLYYYFKRDQVENIEQPTPDPSSRTLSEIPSPSSSASSSASSPSALPFSQKSSNELKFAVGSKMGRRPSMEDAHCMLETIGESYSFFGVYDGHGGDKAALYIEKELPSLLEKYLTEGNSQEESLTEAILELEKNFMKLAVETQIQDGSTIVCALIGNGQLTVANVGDSEAVLYKGEDGFQLLSTVHTPARNPSEKERIEQVGGRIHRGRVGHPHLNPQYFNLAVSRAVGDIMYKEKAFVNDKESGVVANPDLVSVSLSSKEKFLILACDGIWDVINYEAACNFVEKHLNEGRSVQDTADALVNEAYDQQSTDNITACLVVFDK